MSTRPMPLQLTEPGGPGAGTAGGIHPSAPCPRERFFRETRKRDEGDARGIVEKR
jgi:hypothetical protein